MSDEINTTSRQYWNLWGDSVGQLNQLYEEEKRDVSIKIDKLPEIELEFNDTTKMNNIPDDAEVYVIFRDKFRKQRFYLGTRVELCKARDVDDGSEKLTAFGDKYGESKWIIKFINGETKFTYAWTEAEILNSRAKDLVSFNGKSLISIAVDENDLLETFESWGLSFEQETPTILINKNNTQLIDKFYDDKDLSTLLVLPEIFSRVIDRLIYDHCEEPISENDDTWQGRWLRWCHDRTENKLLSDIPDNNEDFQSCLDFKEDIVKLVKKTIKQSNHIHEIFEGDDA